jgi:hypothetical protein
VLTEWERWAVAVFTLEQHGLDAPRFVATRIGALAAAGDIAGVIAWKEIARRMNELTATTPAKFTH